MSKAALPLEDWSLAGKHFPHHGHEIFYRDSQGSGGQPTLLLIHGYPTSSIDFARIWTTLAARFRLIAPDLVGFGFSAKPKNYHYSIVDQAELCANLCVRQGVREVHVLAHDYGVSVAQELIAREHEKRGILRLKSVAFLNGGLFPEAHRPRPIQRLLHSPLGAILSRFTTRERFARSFAEVFSAAHQPDDQELSVYWQLLTHNGGLKVQHQLIRYIDERLEQRQRWVPAMQFSATPMCFINGVEDPVSGAHMADRYTELIPRPDLTLLSGVGHYPQLEAPDAVLDALRLFHGKHA